MGLLQKIFNRIFGQEDRILRELAIIKQQNVLIMEDLSRIEAAVAREVTVVQSVVTLIGNMATQLRNLPTSDPATQKALNDYADKIEAQSDLLAQAVAANTPASTPSTGDGSEGTDTSGGTGDAPAPDPGTGTGDEPAPDGPTTDTSTSDQP